MIFNEQLQQRNAYNQQALDEAKEALSELVEKPGKCAAENSSDMEDGRDHCMRVDLRFPSRPINFKDMLILGLKAIDKRDIVWIVLTFALVAGIEMASPWVTKYLYETVIPEGMPKELMIVVGLMVGVSLGSVLFDAAKNHALMRIRSKVESGLQSAMIARTYALPATFFRRFSSGDLSNRVSNMTILSYMFTNGVLANALTGVFSVVYLFQVFVYAMPLLPACLLILFANICFMLCEYSIERMHQRHYMPKKSLLEGLLYSLYSGIQKIKTSGSEVRAFSKWAKAYRESRPTAYEDYAERFSAAISGLISTAGMAFIYYQAVTYNVSLSSYMAFSVAFGLATAGLASFSAVMPSLATVQSLLQLMKPIMDETPEAAEEAPKVKDLMGGIQVHNLYFRYSEDTPYVFNGLNLRIYPGEYVGIVGRSGCGKSTLMRLLLGFEKPENGSIFYDTYSLERIDKPSLRNHIGTCMQDGELFSGSILDNLTITAPQATQEDVWEAARLAGVDEDIRKMPMQLYTLLSDGGGGISGGQRQRLLIARALVNKPSILFFDEATSALDNITQRKVAENLETLYCTRIHVAHRLSTIKHCDRIIVLDQGKVAEEGTYQDLLDKQGIFYELVKQQL